MGAWKMELQIAEGYWGQCDKEWACEWLGVCQLEKVGTTPQAGLLSSVEERQTVLCNQAEGVSGGRGAGE